MDNPSPRERPALSQTEKYVLDTGFPNSTDTIRSHLRSVFQQAIPVDSPVVKITCDPLCSVGHLKNNAIPGSDVDKLLVFYNGHQTKEDQKKIAQAVGKLTNRQLVYLPDNTPPGASYVDLSKLIKVKDRSWSDLTESDKIELGQDLFMYQMLVHGTSLFERDNELIKQLIDSPFGKTIPAFTFSANIENDGTRARKYSSRSYLHKRFSSMTLQEKEVITKAMMQARVEKVEDPIDLEVGGKDEEVLRRLTDMELFVIDGNKYFPAWIYGTEND